MTLFCVAFPTSDSDRTCPHSPNPVPMAIQPRPPAYPRNTQRAIWPKLAPLPGIKIPTRKIRPAA